MSKAPFFLTALLGLSGGLTAFVAPLAVAAEDQAAYSFNLPEQALGDTLRAIGQQTATNILFDPETVMHRTAPALRGTLTANEAIARVLAGSNLSARQSADTVLIRVTGSETAGTTAVSDGAEAVTLAQADTSADSGSSPSGQGLGENQNTEDSSQDAKLEEVIVTAQKRVERLQDVPVPVTVISAAALVDSNQLRLQDYYARIPGLNVSIMSLGFPVIALRGVTTGGFINPTVATVVDDIPVGGSTVAGNAAFTFASDFDPSELARIEVLRGPQGTLYGASSMGGLIKYVTLDPSTERVSGRLQIGTAGVSKSDDLGYSVSGGVNLPVGDKFAVRVSGSMRRDPGYIDNVQTGQKDVNQIDSKGARLAALWKPMDKFSLKLSALYQRTERDASSDVHLPSPIGPSPDLRDLQQSALINTGGNAQELQAYSATAVLGVGSAELTSLSGYSVVRPSSSLDGSPAAGGLAQANFGVAGFEQHGDNKLGKFSQELRLSTPIGDRLQWLLGAFYTNEDYKGSFAQVAVNPSSGVVVGSLAQGGYDGSYKEYAGFTDLTIQIIDRFDIQVGARASRNETASESVTTGIVGPNVRPRAESKDRAYTYLLTPRFKVSPDLMVYARLASGYRPGGPNSFPLGTIVGVPTEFGHDTTWNYEVGVKGFALNRVLSFDASLYYIDWKDVQLQLRSQVPSGLFQTYTFNAGGAKSEGVELSLQSSPLEGLTIFASGAYNIAELTNVPTNSLLTARAGDRLPYSPRWSGYLSVDQDLPLTANVTGFAGVSISYVGDRKGRFFTGVAQGAFPAYTQMDLRIGARFGSWTTNAYVNNLTDKRGVLAGGRDSVLSLPYVFAYIQPRTLGLSLTKTF